MQLWSLYILNSALKCCYGMPNMAVTEIPRVPKERKLHFSTPVNLICPKSAQKSEDTFPFSKETSQRY